LIFKTVPASFLALDPDARTTDEHVVVEVLSYLFVVRGAPQLLRSDDGPEFASEAVTKWLAETGVETQFIASGSPWENGYMESFNEKLRDELLNRELFLHLDEVRYVVDRWRMD
jgi:transposase InsO family protein